MKPLIEALQWRSATKLYDSTRHLSEEDFLTLMEAVRLSPSSFGLPTWKVITVNDPLLRAEIKKVAWNQSQITDASHLVIFAVHTHIDEQLIDDFIAHMAKTRNVSLESLEGYRSLMKNNLLARTEEERIAWAARQAYIGLGTLLTSAALQKIDATPIEGFDPRAVDALLHLSQDGLQSVVIATLGYRSPEDHYGALPKVRPALTDFLIVR